MSFRLSNQFQKRHKLKQMLLKANVAKAQSSSKKNKKKNKKNEGRNKVANGGKFKKNKNNNQDKKPKGKCFHCGLDGHWKRNCKKYLEELKQKKKGKFDLLVLEACLVENDLSPWIVDS